MEHLTSACRLVYLPAEFGLLRTHDMQSYLTTSTNLHQQRQENLLHASEAIKPCFCALLVLFLLFPISTTLFLPPSLPTVYSVVHQTIPTRPL